jgi:hypothetical protein
VSPIDGDSEGEHAGPLLPRRQGEVPLRRRTRARGRRVVVGVGDTGDGSVTADTLTAPNPPGIPVAGGSLPVTLPR